MKKSVIKLYSDQSVYSHVVKLVLAEQAINVNISHLTKGEFPEILSEINPGKSLPTLIDRELILYNTQIICEYLDERYPYPILLPVYPIARAKCRLTIFRMDVDWITPLSIVPSGHKSDRDSTKKNILHQISDLAPVFEKMPFFLSEEFTLIDCYLSAFFWELLHNLNVDFPKSAKAIDSYARKMFDRVAFKISMSNQSDDSSAKA